MKAKNIYRPTTYAGYDAANIECNFKKGEHTMELRLEMDNWIVNDEYFITEGIREYEVYNCGTDEDEAEKLFSSTSFEECLTWIWNSL